MPCRAPADPGLLPLRKLKDLHDCVGDLHVLSVPNRPIMAVTTQSDYVTWDIGKMLYVSMEIRRGVARVKRQVVVDICCLGGLG